MLTNSRRRLVVEFAKAELVGVGQLPSRVEQFEVAFHYRRALTDEEIAGLPLKWCEIPAVDLAGHGKVIEENT